MNATHFNHEEELDRFEQTLAGIPEDDLTETPIDESPELKTLPKRIFIFTSMHLLSLFENNDGKGSFDGTFSSCPMFFKQSFVWMIKYSKFWIPVAWAWLPDKNLEPYQVCYLMILLKEAEGK